MSATRYSIGLDFGTNSVRALIVEVSTGAEIATAVSNYRRGDAGVIGDPANPHVARQHPLDYQECLVECVQEALSLAALTAGFSADDIIGIGVDTTGSTPLPVAADGTPLALLPQFADNPNALAWLWKDHSSMHEAEEITSLAAQHRPQYLCKSGGTYSSEWFWAKLWHCLKVAPDVFAAAHSWVEFCDYLPALLVGDTNPATLKRGVCAAGHKAMYCEEWNGLPDAEFLALLDPQIAALRGRLYEQAYPSDVRAGTLCAEWAAKTGLPEGIPVAVGAFDAHHGAVACGVGVGTLVKILGTSTCDITVAAKTGDPLDIPGVCGIVDGSVLPRAYGVEAGQSAVGDLFNWFVGDVCLADDSYHANLTAEAEALKPGQSGLLALDWNNGNRCVLVDARLTGVLLGQTLHTSRAEMYRALIEATAFGALTIQNRMKEYGVPIDRIICAGGIAEKNAFLMQLYADVMGQSLEVSRSGQTCALGAAIFGTVVAGSEAGGYACAENAQAKMTGVKEIIYRPNPEAHAIYQELYKLYLRVHDAFGVPGSCGDLTEVMKKLLDLKQRVS